jgi:hypothetical protein
MWVWAGQVKNKLFHSKEGGAKIGNARKIHSVWEGQTAGTDIQTKGERGSNLYAL